MGVQVNEPGSNVETLRVDHPRSVSLRNATDGGDHAVADRNVSAIARHPRAVEYQPVLDDDIIGWH